MAYSWTPNLTPATGAVAVYELKERLKAAGATVLSSSDGTTYNSSGDQITSGNSGAGGLANTNAWFRVQLADGVRQMTFQRGSGNTAWRIKYSASAGFTGGSPGATQTPTASDGQVFFGGGTDASPTFATWFNTDGTYRAHVGADNAAPYSWWFATYPTGGGTPNGGMVYDPVQVPAAADTDPVVISVAISSGGFTAATIGAVSTSSTAARVVGWLKHNLVGAGYVAIPGNKIASVGGGDLAPEGAGSNPHSGNDDMFPIIYGRPTGQAAPQGYKGISSVMYWNGTMRATGDTLTVSSSRDRLILGQVSVPWNGQVPTV